MYLQRLVFNLIAFLDLLALKPNNILCDSKIIKHSKVQWDRSFLQRVVKADDSTYRYRQVDVHTFLHTPSLPLKIYSNLSSVYKHLIWKNILSRETCFKLQDNGSRCSFNKDVALLNFLWQLGAL